MKVIDFHIHNAGAFLPPVHRFVRELNPGYFQRFKVDPGPGEVVAHFLSQGVSRMVMLAEYAPGVTGEVSNESVARFCRDHGELIPVASISLDSGIPVRHLPTLFPKLERHAHRFIFGSDWPAVPMDVKGLVDRVLALPYSHETKAKILHGNADRVLAAGQRP